MSLKKERFIKGIILAPDTLALDGLEGEIKVDSATGKIQVTLKDGANPSAAREILTSSQTQTLTNKTLDADLNIISNIETADLKAGVLNVNTSLTGASDTQIPSALAAKTYIDTANTAQQNIIDDLVTLSGVASGAENLGTFTGTTIPDNSTNKQALQALETEVETKATSAALSTHTGASSDVHGVGVGNSVVGTGTSQALTNKTIDADLNTISNIEDADIKVGAAISRAKLASGTANRVVINNGTGVQTDAAAITASRALVSDANGIPTHSAVTTTTLEFLDATSSVQTQLNSKVNASGGTLTNGSIVTPIRSDVKQDTKANLTTYALTATNGQLVFATDTKELFQVIDGLLKAAGGVGGAADVNALLIQTFDTSAVSDFTQTGLSLTTTNPVNGAQSAALTHQTGVSPTNDQLFTQTISVDRKFRGQLMQLSLNVRSTASSGNLTVSVRDVTNNATILSSQQIQTDSNPFTANTNSNTTLSNISNADMALLAVGDAVSGSNIPTGAVITALGTNQVTISAAATATASGVSLRASSLPARRVFSFTIPANCASLSYTVTALPEANSPRSVIDDVVIELASTALLSTSVDVPNLTAWNGYTPTFQGFGTPTNVEFEWRQVGENVEIRGKFTSGTSTAVTAQVSLPNGYTSAGTGIIPSIQANGFWLNSANNANHGGAVLISPSLTYVTFGPRGTFGSAVETPLASQNANAMVSSGESISFSTSVPVLGLSATSTKTIALTQSGLVQNADSYYKAQGFSGALGSTNTGVLRLNDSTYLENIGSGFTVNSDSVNGTSITINESGIYSLHYIINAAPPQRVWYFTKNSTTLTAGTVSTQSQIIAQTFTDSPADNDAWELSATPYLNIGDIIRVQCNGATNITGTSNSFTIARQGSLKQVAINPNSRITIPTSELRFEGASTRGSTDTAIVRFDTQAKIRGDAFSVVSTAVNGTAVTMLKAGKLNVGVSLTTSVASSFQITRNQTILTGLSNIASESLASQSIDGATNIASASVDINVAVGDIIRVAHNTNPLASTVNCLNLSFQEQNIAVSVTNTLPQFSESDSSVRVDTANGYGSTGTKIRRFSNVRDNIGTDVEYTDSAANGASFTVKSDGIYEISYTDQFNSLEYAGITKNASSLTTNVNNLSSNERLSMGTSPAAHVTGVASWSGYLVSGDVIRAHTSGTPSGTNPDRSTFTISKVGKPNVTGVNVTPFVNVPQPLSQSSFLSPGGPFAGGATVTGALTSNTNDGLYSYNSTTGIYTALKDLKLNLSITAAATGATSTLAIVYVNGAAVGQGNSLAVASTFATGAWSGKVSTGGTFYFGIGNAASSAQQISVLATANADQILTAPETFSTDTAAFTYAGSATYTLATLTNAPVGTYLTYTYAASTNTRTQTTTRPTQTDADMNANGMLIYRRAHNALSSAAQPTAFAIQIGKGLKGKSINGYASAAKVDPASLDFTYLGTTVIVGLTFAEYNETTGVLYLDAGYDANATSTSRAFLTSATPSSQASAYLVINASRNPALTGIGLNRIAARAVQTSGQVFGNTATTVLWDSAKTFDTHGIINTGTGVAIIPETGYYQVNATVHIDANAVLAANQRAFLAIVKNGVTYSLGEYRVQTTANLNSFIVTVNDVVFLGKGDTVSISLTHNITASRALLASAGYNYFAITKTSV
jgi:hypothetical protein